MKKDDSVSGQSVAANCPATRIIKIKKGQTNFHMIFSTTAHLNTAAKTGTEQITQFRFERDELKN